MSPVERQIQSAIDRLALLISHAHEAIDALRAVLVTMRQVREATRDT